MSLDPYYGGFLNSPIPLELSLNYCSHSCHFCYANLNSSKRTVDITQIMGLISQFRERNSFAARLLQLGYPVMCSTHVDFFAKSNEEIAMVLLEMLSELEIPVQIMTKGGDRFIEAVSTLKPSVIYFSFSTLDDELASVTEPGAPLPSDRLKMIRKAQEYGHRIVGGINPCVPDWIGDPFVFVSALQSTGVEGVIIQPMHLNNRQIQAMNVEAIAALGETVLKQAKRKDRDKDVAYILKATNTAARSIGLSVYRVGQAIKSNYYEPFKAIYPKLYPTLQDFVNYCYEENKDPDEPIYWKEFRDFFVPLFPDGVFPLRNHLSACQNKYWCAKWNDRIPKNMTYEALLRWCWQLNDIAYSPVNALGFRWAARSATENDTPGWYEYVDPENMPILLFRPDSKKLEVYDEWRIYQDVEQTRVPDRQF
jgi:DNA repair photolyase